MDGWITPTRQELYDLVWQKPVAQLAAEFSMSAVGIEKLCARNSIPTPPRGYWAMLEAGKAPARAALPQVDTFRPIYIRVREPEERIAQVEDDLAAGIKFEQQPENRIKVADRLQTPCALVQKARTAFQDAKQDADGFLVQPSDSLSLRVSRTQLPRALRIADVLVKACEARSWKVCFDKGKTLISLQGVSLSIVIEEETETEERPQVPDAKSGYSFQYRYHETVRKPTGRLILSLDENRYMGGRPQRRNWHDSEKHVLEDILNDVIIGMLKLAAAVRRDMAKQERKAEQVRDYERRVEAALDEQNRRRAAFAKEKAAVQLLFDQSVRWRESQSVRLFVEQARERGHLPEMNLEGQELEEWSRWALQQADRMDPFTTSPPSILDDAEKIEHMCDEIQGRR